MSRSQYSSFQIAKMLNVSRQAVNQWIDKGFINSYRTPGGHRRVSRKDLIAFLDSRSIPVPDDLRRGRGDGPDISSIVLIDDDTDFMMLMSQALSDVLPGVEIRKYTSGLDGLIAIGASLPDLLLVDLRMPGLDGVEVIDRIKSNPLTETLPIIVVTSYDVKMAAGKLGKLRVGGIVAKQLGLNEMVQKILELNELAAQSA